MSAPSKIDRQTTTPFLLKLFYRTGTFHRLDEFSPSSSAPPPHLQIYTWPTCTLRELTHLLTSALPSLLPSPAIGTRLAFRLIFPDTREPARPGPGRYLSKELGSVVVGAGGPGVELGEGREGDDAAAAGGNGELERLEGDAEKTLQEGRFVIGDFISCAVFPPLPNGDVAGPPPRSTGFGAGRGDFGGGRGGPPANGYGGPAGGGYGGFGGRRGGSGARFESARGGMPSGEWRRGERVPEAMGGGYGRGRGRGRGY